jgi:hypothetical protein
VTVTKLKAYAIEEVGVGADKRLFVKPRKSKSSFEFVYRAAMEVYWVEDRFLTPDKPEWSYAQWFKQICKATERELGIDLQLTLDTIWTNVPIDQRVKIETGT